MMKQSYLLIFSILLLSCNSKTLVPITQVSISELYKDSVSIRAISIDKNKLFFGTSKAYVGVLDLDTHQLDSLVVPNQAFRATAVNSKGYYALSINNPAQLLSIDADFNAKVVYSESGEGVFYDALHFVNDEVGFGLGDNYDGCMSVLKTVDGGLSWNKISCSELPPSELGEGAFAASNTNIESVGSNLWMATTKGAVYRSNDLGEHWESVKSPLVDSLATHGIYSMDFYDELRGIIYGGDYTKPDYNKNNIAITTDGGLHWNLIADGTNLGYKSCVQFVPNSNAQQIVAVGFTGIVVSNDGGLSWNTLSSESFFTLRFIDEHTAYAAGRGRIARLEFN